MTEQPRPFEALSDEQLNIEVAKVAGYSIYHYDKDYEHNCYYMLWEPNSIDWAGQGDWERFGHEIRERRFRAGERKTEEEAWKDAPYFASDLRKIWPLFEAHDLTKHGKRRLLGPLHKYLYHSPERAARLLAELFLEMKAETK